MRFDDAASDKSCAAAAAAAGPPGPLAVAHSSRLISTR